MLALWKTGSSISAVAESILQGMTEHTAALFKRSLGGLCTNVPMQLQQGPRGRIINHVDIHLV